ncbi:MAG TPA: L-threonylcarbamoyladenylate synthase [Flavobacteriaceae bacterium]|nr:L-threonylcarbamoyladenylate synthase [Flavobacteriaceae bacterium]
MNKELENTLKTLSEGGLILYPTDTVWGIGCDATNPQAVEKVYQLKKRHDSKALICLAADDRMLKNYIEQIPQMALTILEIANKPTTIIYDGAKNLAPNLIAADRTIAFRIPDDEFCFRLLRKFNKPIVSTSANISGQPTPKSFKEISNEIIKGVDYVVNLHREKICTSPSAIIKLSTDGQVKIIRT